MSKKKDKKQKHLIHCTLEWEDAYHDMEDVTDKKIQKKIAPRIMRVSGWLVKENKHHVVIAWEWDDLTREWRGHQVIPKHMIRNFVKYTPIPIKKPKAV